MTRFNNSSSVARKGGELLTVKRQDNMPEVNLSDEKIAEIVDNAAAMLDQTIAYLSDPQGRNNEQTIAAFQMYFHDTDFGQDSCEKMLQVLQLTRAGLTEDMTLKIGHSAAGDGSSGAVTFRRVRTARSWKHPFERLHTLKEHQNYMPNLGPQMANDPQSGQHHSLVRGAIRIRHTQFLGMMNSKYDKARTLIHEATHKFAGTNDWFYLDKSGKRSDIVTDGGANPGLPHALANADSYAYFCTELAGALDA